MRIIKVLTNKDAKHFNKEAPKYEVVIAGFFMVNCPACDAFKPEWNNFVKSCEHKDEPRVLIAEVDSNHASNVDFDTSALEGFPTVYRDVKRDHGVEEFKRERSAKALHHFLKEAIAAKKKAHKREHMHGGKRRKTRKKKKRKTLKKKGGNGKQNKKTRKKRHGNRLVKGLVGALALSSTLGSAAPTKSVIRGLGSVPTASINFAPQSSSAMALASPPTNYDFNQSSLTFSGPGGYTPNPTFETAPFTFPKANTSTTISAVSPGMNLNPNKNYSITVKSIHNPSFGPVGSIDPLTHHTLEVQEVNTNNKLVGNPAHVGYYAKATPSSVAKYNKKHPGRPKLNAHDMGSIMSPTGVPGHFQTPDAIVESGVTRGQTLKTVGKPKIISGKIFNQEIGKSVNLNTRGSYSAPQGAIKGFLQNVAGNEAANKVCGAGNCRTEAADVMSRFDASGGKRKRRKKKERRKSRKKIKKRRTKKRK